MAISDHQRFFDATDFDGEGFLIHPAVEFAVSEPKDGYKGHHLHTCTASSALRSRSPRPVCTG